MKGGSFKKFFNNIAHNQFVLYVLFGLTLLNLVGYLLQNNLAAIVTFLVIGYATTYFSKNMVNVLLTAIIATNLLAYMGFLKKLDILEGLENQNDSHNSDNSSKKSKTSKKSVQSTKSPDDNSEDSEETDDIFILEEEEPKTQTSKTNKSKTSAFENYNDDLTGETPNVDYAKTVESAFDNLEKILGSDGLDKMTDQTARLASKQEHLIKAMNKMEPLMNSAQKMLNQLQGSFLGGMLGKEDQ